MAVLHRKGVDALGEHDVTPLGDVHDFPMGQHALTDTERVGESSRIVAAPDRFHGYVVVEHVLGHQLMGVIEVIVIPGSYEFRDDLYAAHGATSIQHPVDISATLSRTPPVALRRQRSAGWWETGSGRIRSCAR